MELILLAFSAGVLSFLSPCTLPLYPTYLSYISGLSVAQISDRTGQTTDMKKDLFIHSLCFVFGLALVFFLLGSVFTLIGDLFFSYKNFIRMIGAIFIITMGLFLMGVFQPVKMMQEKRFSNIKKPAGY
ncbi:cytochrome c biogenesis CcdA family protein [Oceanobacillus massiliensis]